jgi:hypothetical protein
MFVLSVNGGDSAGGESFTKSAMAISLGGKHASLMFAGMASAVMRLAGWSIRASFNAGVCDGDDALERGSGWAITQGFCLGPGFTINRQRDSTTLGAIIAGMHDRCLTINAIQKCQLRHTEQWRHATPRFVAFIEQSHNRAIVSRSDVVEQWVEKVQ